MTNTFPFGCQVAGLGIKEQKDVNDRKAGRSYTWNVYIHALLPTLRSADIPLFLCYQTIQPPTIDMARVMHIAG